MKRDFDVIRKLLFYFEQKETPELVKVPSVEGYDDMMIKYHLVLLYDAGFLRCEPMRSSTSDRVICVSPFELTWAGHEFLEKIRSDGVWNRIQGDIRSEGGVMAFSVIERIATNFALEVFDT